MFKQYMLLLLSCSYFMELFLTELTNSINCNKFFCTYFYQSYSF